MLNVSLPKNLISILTPEKLEKFIKKLHFNKKINIKTEREFFTVYINLLKAIQVYFMNKKIKSNEKIHKVVLFNNAIQNIQNIINIIIEKKF